MLAEFFSREMNLAFQHSKRHPSAIYNQHQKSLIEQNPNQNVRQISQIMSFSIPIISENLKKISKIKPFDNCFLNGFRVKALELSFCLSNGDLGREMDLLIRFLVANNQVTSLIMQTLSKTGIVPTKHYGEYLVLCILRYPLQISVI